MILKVLILCCLVFLFYQDMRYRAVYWLVFPGMTLLLVGIRYGNTPIGGILENGTYNILFLLLQMVILTLYFSIKNRSWVNITTRHMGWGDLLFLVSIAFYLSPLNYLFFYIGSLLCVLLFVALSAFAGRSSRKIPLAGLQAILLALLFVIDWNIYTADMTSDTWMLSKLMK